MNRHSICNITLISLACALIFGITSCGEAITGEGTQLTSPYAIEPDLSEIEPITENRIGHYDGFDFELWKNEASDEASMCLTGGGTFHGTWNGFALMRTGAKLGSVNAYEHYGDIILEYAAEHNIMQGDVSYLCMYGWTVSPLVEFYIVENHGSYRPPGGKGYVGSYEMDGGTYDVFTDIREQQPSIQGTATFSQYFAVRKERRTEGTLTVSEHFKNWENLGLDMSGLLYEISLCVEGYRSRGDVTVSKNILIIGETVNGE